MVHRPAPAPGVPRLAQFALLLGLLFGLLAMHHLPHSPPGGGAHHSASAPASGHESDCAGDDCGDSSMLHLCLAVLSAAAGLLGLLLLARLWPAPQFATLAGRVRLPVSYQANAPPWTGPSLSALGVLRL